MKQRDWPEEHMPTSLRPKEVEPREERYGISSKNGMEHGPCKYLIDCLDHVGNKGELIIHFRRDGVDEVIYRWKVKSNCWKRVIKKGKDNV